MTSIETCRVLNPVLIPYCHRQVSVTASQPHRTESQSPINNHRESVTIWTITDYRDGSLYTKSTDQINKCCIC